MMHWLSLIFLSIFQIMCHCKVSLVIDGYQLTIKDQTFQTYLKAWIFGASDDFRSSFVWKKKFRSKKMYWPVWTDRSGSPVKTQIRLKTLQVFTFLHSILNFCSHYSMVKPQCSKFRVFSGVQIFLIFIAISLVSCGNTLFLLRYF